MSKYSGSGWHFQHIRHSNARKYGRAGGVYAKDGRQLFVTKQEGYPSRLVWAKDVEDVEKQIGATREIIDIVPVKKKGLEEKEPDWSSSMIPANRKKEDDTEEEYMEKGREEERIHSQLWDTKEEVTRLERALEDYERNTPMDAYMYVEEDFIELRKKLNEIKNNPKKFIDKD